MIIQFFKDDKVIHAYLGIDTMITYRDGEIYLVYDVGDDQTMNVTWYAADYDEVSITKK